MTPNPIYHSFLLRLWRTSPSGNWRASLHCTATNEQYTFHEVAELFEFLTANLISTPEILIINEDEARPGQE